MANIPNILDTPAPGSIVGAGIYEYDFAVDGGAIGNINLRLISGSAIPANANIITVSTRMITRLHFGAGSLINETLEAAGDLVSLGTSPGVTNDNDLDTFVSDVASGYFGASMTSAGTGIRTTVPRTPILNVSVNALTQGKFRQAFEWFLST